jgi:hypothetical protein
MLRHRICPRTRLLLLSSLIATAYATHAEAQEWSRHHAAGCRPEFGTVPRHAVGGGGVTAYPAGYSSVKCELPDRTAGPDSAITRIRIYVRDAASWDTFVARACTTTRDGLDVGECGPPVESGETFTGDAVLTLGATELAPLATTDFGSIYVYIPNRSDEIGWSYFKGYVIER